MGIIDRAYSKGGGGSGDMTKAVYDTNDNGRADVSESLVFDVRFTEAVTAGDLVYLSGYNAGQDIVEASIADITDVNKRPAAGVVLASAAMNATGAVMNIGRVTVIDTSTFTAGDIVYLSTAGTVTNVEPSPLSQQIGIVTRAHASMGRIAVNVQQIIDISGGGGSSAPSAAFIEDDTNEPHGAGFQVISFNTEVYDDNDFATLGTNDDRLTVPTGVTRVNISCYLEISAGVAAGTGNRLSIRHKNSGGTVIREVAGHSADHFYDTPRISCAGIGIPVTAGDYFEILSIFEDSTVTLAYRSFSIQVVS